jgi:hypothetical protein
MSHTEPNRSAEVQQAFIALFGGVVPERKTEFDELWKKYQIEISLVPDGKEIVAEAGVYKHIKYNDRILRAVWVSAFAAWEGYVAVHEMAVDNSGVPNLERFRKLIDCVGAICVSDNPFGVQLPGIPEMGVLPTGAANVQLRAASELAFFATAWIMLHEIRHIFHQQDGTSSTWDGPEAMRREEFSCDEFASKFLTEKANDYATQNNVFPDSVLFKRKTGIYFGVFALALLAQGNWGQSGSHPSVQARLDAVKNLLSKTAIDKEFAVAASAFAALNEVFPHSPFPSL